MLEVDHDRLPLVLPFSEPCGGGVAERVGVEDPE